MKSQTVIVQLKTFERFITVVSSSPQAINLILKQNKRTVTHMNFEISLYYCLLCDFITSFVGDAHVPSLLPLRLGLALQLPSLLLQLLLRYLPWYQSLQTRPITAIKIRFSFLPPSGPCTKIGNKDFNDPFCT